MDHFVAAAIAEDRLDLAAAMPGDRLRVGARIRREPARELAPVAAAHNNRIALLEGSLNRHHAGRQQARAARERADRAVVDDERAGDVDRARDPAFARRARFGIGNEPASRARPLRSPPAGAVPRRARSPCGSPRPSRCARPRASSPCRPNCSRAGARPAIASISGVISRTSGRCCAAESRRGSAV